jgi:hypothetical protein
MKWNFYRPYFDLIKFQSNAPLPQTKATFKALVDALIPRSPELAEIKGSIQSVGGIDLHADEYLIWSLNYELSINILGKTFNVNLANATAEMLNIVARQLIDRGENGKPVKPYLGPEEGIFAALEPYDRLRAIRLLEKLEVDLASLPIPFRNNSGFVLTIAGVLAIHVIDGYYTEWSGLGATRLETPEQRKIEDFPISWQQVGYPGPSKGYHALRGFLIEKFTE